MCGIAGFVSKKCSEADLTKMGDVLTHRGPDETGYFYLENVGLVSKRLSIVDLNNGKQPAYNEDKHVAVVLNGEIFNYLQLREDLESKGHIISNNSDTAVLPHLYEEFGKDMFERLSGQFAIAVYDRYNGKLLLARDKMGIIPLYYYYRDGEFLFGSEIKAILTSGIVGRELSCQALFEVFTFWSPQQEHTIFQDIFSILPGECLEFQNRVIRKYVYGTLRFRKTDIRPDTGRTAEELEELLCKAVQKRLLGDVKVSAYLSGGLDSSLVASILASRYNSQAEAFSVGFEDGRFDESKYQKLVCDYLGIKHHTILFENKEMPGLMKKIVWHTETPLLRAGPAPLFKLSELVQQNHIKVVLSGEGADELFGGYDIFREVKIKAFLKKHPDLVSGKKLFGRINLFSDSSLQSANAGSLNYFYMQGGDSPIGSHYNRWNQFGFFERFFSASVNAIILKKRLRDINKSLELNHMHDFNEWTAIQRSQYLEIKTFLSPYLLSSQGDRVSMAHSVEVRFPFLDDELATYCMSLNDCLKIKALNEKYILKKIAEKYLPLELVYRKKFPYRSPLDAKKMVSDPYMAYVLSEESIRRYNVFDPAKIRGFIGRILEKGVLSERETMLLMGVMTTQALCDLFAMEPVRKEGACEAS